MIATDNLHSLSTASKPGLMTQVAWHTPAGTQDTRMVAREQRDTDAWSDWRPLADDVSRTVQRLADYEVSDYAAAWLVIIL